jgi:hypothetical protein
MAQNITQPDDSAEPKTELKRVIGPGLLLLFIVGDILGRVPINGVHLVDVV